MTNNTKDGKPRYKKTPRREAEDSDEDDMLSPSEMAKSRSAQKRRSTRPSDSRAVMKIYGSQKPPVRSGRQRSKTIEE